MPQLRIAFNGAMTTNTTGISATKCKSRKVMPYWQHLYLGELLIELWAMQLRHACGP